eukprot:CAMPEP_0171462864 /NCGR_PEP_ID=MMETSP0945-20130129/6739_1 /TAXON_ID=109269 /ORGANISM="Vaucheria litorea, Strain CCMP2940" /LENGTH=121 /DNA_ID=CAMNT_0011989491 /DNA_START=396 /DNA_END=761 /DNA_ORIENTATION=+
MAEGVADASRVLSPPANIPLRIAPQQVTEQAIVRYIDGPGYVKDLTQALEFRADSAMRAEYLVFDDGSHGHAVETVGEVPPQFYGVPPLALVVETVYAVQAGALVVPSQEKEALRVFQFVA